MHKLVLGCLEMIETLYRKFHFTPLPHDLHSRLFEYVIACRLAFQLGAKMDEHPVQAIFFRATLGHNDSEREQHHHDIQPGLGQPCKRDPSVLTLRFRRYVFSKQFTKLATS